MEEERKKVGTHSGVFHADEVLACAMLTRYTQAYKNGIISRSRDPEVWKQQDLLVDVGGVYEPENHRYDHHQRSFTGTLEYKDFNKTKLSGAGLIYKHFGMEIIKNVIQKILSESKLNVEIDGNDETIIELVYTKVYKNFIESVDGTDNGVNQYDTKDEPNYKENTNFGCRIGRMNPMWTEVEQNEDASFMKALEIADEELIYQVKNVLIKWYPARPHVLKGIAERFETHASGEIIKLGQAVPWAGHLIDIEEEQKLEGVTKFVLFPENGGRAWRVQAINLKDSFDLRVGLKKEWRGIKEMDVLKQTSGIEDIVFVHVAGFIGGARSYESALRMAVESLEAAKQQ